MATRAIERDVFYDILKGYAIFLVAWGHSIQTMLSDWQSNPVLLAIYMFHMPLFIAISGRFFLSSVERSSTTDFIKRKFLHLYLPSLTWGFLMSVVMLVHKFLKHKPIDIGYFLNITFTGMWFLTVLFIVSVMGCLIYKKFKEKLRIPAAVTLLICFYLLPSNIWLSNEISFLAPFFFLAVLLHQYDWKRIPWWIAFVALCLFIICFNHYTFRSSMYMAINHYDAQTFYNIILRLISGLCGIIISSFLISCIYRLNVFRGGIFTSWATRPWRSMCFTKSFSCSQNNTFLSVYSQHL